MIVSIVSSLGMLFSIAGNILLARKSSWCFLIGNVMWILYSIRFSPNIPMIAQYLVFIAINVYGILEYRKDKHQ